MKKLLLTYLLFLTTIVIYGQTVYSTSDINLRNGPSTSFNIIRTIPKGAILLLDDNCKQCKWKKVYYNGRTGYVSSKYISKNNYTDTYISQKKSYNRSNNYYINTRGNRVQSPTYYQSQPSGASAICRDGTYSFSQSRRGTCSRHGGVSSWL